MWVPHGDTSHRVCCGNRMDAVVTRHHDRRTVYDWDSKATCLLIRFAEFHLDLLPHVTTVRANLCMHGACGPVLARTGPSISGVHIASMETNKEVSLIVSIGTHTCVSTTESSVCACLGIELDNVVASGRQTVSKPVCIAVGNDLLDSQSPPQAMAP